MRREGGTPLRLVLEGCIDERLPWKQWTELGPSVTIDLAGVNRITSAGVREWVFFVASLSEAGTEFALERCSPPIVSQINLVTSFLGKGRVHSVLAPYLCSQCGAESNELYALTGPLKFVEEKPCGECDGVLQFDDLPTEYFGFHLNQRTP